MRTAQIKKIEPFNSDSLFTLPQILSTCLSAYLSSRLRAPLARLRLLLLLLPLQRLAFAPGSCIATEIVMERFHTVHIDAQLRWRADPSSGFFDAILVRPSLA